MRRNNKREKIPFQEINAAALHRLPELVEQWLPGGKWQGREYLARNPRRNDSKVGSFSINTLSGKWADFATDDAGGDVISLYAYVFGLRQGEAAKDLGQRTGAWMEARTPLGSQQRMVARIGSHGAVASLPPMRARPGPNLRVVETTREDLPDRFRATPDDGMAVKGPEVGPEPSGRVEDEEYVALRQSEPVVAPMPVSDKKEPSTDGKRSRRSVREKAADLWRNTEAPSHPLLQQYLATRGLFRLEADLLQDLRLHLELEYWNSTEDGGVESLGKFPSMLAVVRDVNGRGVGLHRTYLQHEGEGKLVLPDPNNPWDEEPLPAKKLLAFESGITRGAAIRLGQSAVGGMPKTLHVAEGIETALAPLLMIGGDVWATISAGGMAALLVPASYSKVVVWADKDLSKAGQNAADALADRLRKDGVHTEIRTPPMAIPEGKKGVDWLDVLQLPQPKAAKAFAKRGWLF